MGKGKSIVEIMLSKFKDFAGGNRGILILAVCVNAVFGFYPVPLFDEDEGFTAEVAREMLDRGEFILLESNYEPRYDKPPLAFWVMSGSLYLFGNNELAARFPAIWASLILQYLIYGFIRKRYGEDRAVITGLFVAGSLQFALMSKSAIADPLLYLFVTGAIFSLIRFAEEGIQKDLFLFMLWNALAFLTKGPVVLFISAVAVLTVVVCQKKASFIWKVLKPLPLLVFLLLVLPWFVLSYDKVGMLIIEDFFFKHNFGRFSQPMEGHGGSYFYYFGVLLIGFLPFSLSHVYGFYRCLATTSQPLLRLFRGDQRRDIQTKNERAGFKPQAGSATREEDIAAQNTGPRGDLAATVFLIWFIAVFILFTFSATKLPHYLMLGFFPLAMLSSAYFSRRGLLISGALACLLIFLLWSAPLVAVHLVPQIRDEYARRLISGFPEVFGGLYYGMQLFCLAGAIYSLNQKSTGYVFFFLVSVNSSILAYGLLQQGPVREMAKVVDTEVVMKNHYLPSFSFYRQQAYPVREPLPGEYSVGRISDFRNFDYEILYEKYGTVWVKIKGPR